MIRTARGLAALVLAVLAAVPARADTPPSVWDRAQDPALSASYRLHVEVERRLAQRDRFGVLDAQLRTVRALLERHGADTSPDPRLRFDLGFVYLRLEDFEKAKTTLERVLADHPDHPGAEDGWLRLAFACGHLGEHACEHKAYSEVLRLATEDIVRATPTLNLAETSMHLGNLPDAIEGYREALRISGQVPTRETAPLAVWGLAVALDRSGDRTTAESEARRARELERSMGMLNLLRSDGVFFVPSYEVHWYEGLGASARAKAISGRASVALWRAAEQSFVNYVRFAELAKDRWLELAKLRLATVKAERERAERKFGKELPPGPEEDETAP